MTEETSGDQRLRYCDSCRTYTTHTLVPVSKTAAPTKTGSTRSSRPSARVVYTCNRCSKYH